ncbi:ROK family protein [Microcella sp.]|uniref:ROK family protein n=1 Tax=Microcella sp. TaxID=1913979 RepID=UPI00299F72B7|nr:ROK family protein [Microcella sp.]MDX2026415.1 ROK family protein [Microcella sp.]
MVTSRAATDAGRVRQRNLAAVLQLVHHSRGVTRADLTRALGLNRSTIGDLVAALAEAHWVDEVDDAPREGVGRPSPRVVPRRDRLVAAINPELDAVDVALVALGGRVVARRRVVIDSPAVDQAVSLAARVVGELASEHPSSRVVAAAAAIPGLVRTDDGVVRFAPHLGWREEAFAEPLARALGVPAFAANDAQLGCRAELAFGAGLGARTMVYLNGGASGIGGGIVMSGQLVEGRDGHAGEFGHLSVDPLGPVCACGARGCLEAVVSRAHLVETLGLEHPDDVELEAALSAADSSITDPIVADQFAALRVALRTISTMVNPELIVLGGYLATLWAAASTDGRRAVLAEALPAIAADVRIQPAALGSSRLLIGAGELAWAHIVSDPLAG